MCRTCRQLQKLEVCVCSVEFKPISHLLCLDAHRALIPDWAMGQGLDALSSFCLSMPGLCPWGGRELQLSPTSVLIGLAGLSIPCVIILPCTAVLGSDQHSSTRQEQTKTPTEMREKTQPLLLANFCVSCWQVF